MFPDFPALKDFLTFWETTLDGPLFAVTVAHSKLIKPAELHAIDGLIRLHLHECKGNISANPRPIQRPYLVSPHDLSPQIADIGSHL